MVEGAITDGRSIWGWGLTWKHIDAKNVLRKPTSKSNGEQTSENDLNLLPDVVRELPSRELGPIVIEERSRLPWRPNHFSRTFRKIARAAGLPDDVWNMDSRAGSVTEGFGAGAAPVDVMRTATHTQMKTTMLYDRDDIGHTSRVHQLRAAKRQNSVGDKT